MKRSGKKPKTQEKHLHLKNFFVWDLCEKLAARKVDVSEHLAFLREKGKIPG